jgi:hypothetical protein
MHSLRPGTNVPLKPGSVDMLWSLFKWHALNWPQMLWWMASWCIRAWLEELKLILTCLQIAVLILYTCDQMVYLNVEMRNLLLCLVHLKIEVHCTASSRCRLRELQNICMHSV